jgi:hypothetical protein
MKTINTTNTVAHKKQRRKTMKTYLQLKKFSLWLIGAVLIGLTQVGTSQAFTPSATLDIHVSISGSKSLSIDTTSYNFGALAVNTSSVSAAAVTVTNDSTALLETYTLQGANAVSTGGGTTWNIAASTGVIDEYVLAGQFSASQPANTDTAWSSDSLTVGAIAATDTVLGNGTHAEAANAISPLSGSNDRKLWFRMITPLYVSDVTQRDATLTLAVQ